MDSRSASGARINDLHAYLCAFRSKSPVSANRVTQTRSRPLPPRKRIPEKRFENFQSSEPSRTLAPRRLHILFSVSLSLSLFSLSLPPPYTLLPAVDCPVVQSASNHLFSTSHIHIHIYRPIYKGIHTQRPRSVNWRSLSLSLFFFFRPRYRKSGIKRMMVTKREKIPPPADESGPFGACNYSLVSLARRRGCDSFCVICIYIYIYIYVYVYVYIYRGTAPLERDQRPEFR